VPRRRSSVGGPASGGRKTSPSGPLRRALTRDAQRLCEAIAGRRLVSFTLRGHHRIAEPHDYGIINGIGRLFFYQVGGQSRSRPPIGWRRGSLEEISDVRILDKRFGGPRPTVSGRHIQWDVLIATVSPRPVFEPPRSVSPPPATPRSTSRRKRSR
jgi:hypothetical protein